VRLAGVDMGKVDHLCECPETRALHEAVLTRNGWCLKGGDTMLDWTEADEAARRTSEVPWGFKDPRTLLLTDFWADRNPIYIGTFRSPQEMARSTHFKNPRISQPDALAIWRAYNQRLLDLYWEHRFPIVWYGGPGYEESVTKALAEVGLRLPRTLFKAEQRHHVAYSTDPLYQELQEIRTQ
jgi:hypothetical protein